MNSGGGGGPGELVDVVDTTSQPTSFMELSSTDGLVAVKGVIGGGSSSFQYDHIRCVCEDEDDDGFTIQCDECGVWQHALCVGIGKESVPDSYFCELCRPDLHHKDGYWISKTGIVGMLPSGGAGRKRKGSSLVTLASLSKELSCSEIGENILSKEVIGGLAYLSRTFYHDLLPLMPKPSIRSVWRKTNYEFVDGGIVALPGREVLKEASSRLLEIREIRRYGSAAAQRKVSSSSLPRIGLFTGEDIDPGALITEYIGHVQVPSLLFSLTKGQSLSSPSGNQFILLVPRVRPLICVDARKFGNPTRYIRRSCRPNCSLKIVLTGPGGSGDVHFCVFARNALQEGDELFLPLADAEDEAAWEGLGWKTECACGNPDFCLAPPSLLSSAPLFSAGVSGVGKKSTSSLGASVSFDSYMQGTNVPQPATALPLRSKTPLQQQQQQQQQSKLSREDRKLLQYIEHFEKLDQSERKSASRKSSGMASSTEAVSSSSLRSPVNTNTATPAATTSKTSSPSSPITSSSPDHRSAVAKSKKSKANAVGGSPQKPVVSKKQKPNKVMMMDESNDESLDENDEDTFESSSEDETPVPMKRPSTTSPKLSAKKTATNSPPKKGKTKAAKPESKAEFKNESLPSSPASEKANKVSKAKGNRSSIIAFSDDDNDNDESGNVDVDGEDTFTSGIVFSAALPDDDSPSGRSSPKQTGSAEGSNASQQETPSKKRVSLSDYMRMRKSTTAATTTTATGTAEDGFEDKEEGELLPYHNRSTENYQQRYRSPPPLQAPPPSSSLYTGRRFDSSPPATVSASGGVLPSSSVSALSSDPYDYQQQQLPQQRYSTHQGYDSRQYEIDRKATPPPPTPSQHQQPSHHYNPSRSSSYHRERQFRESRDYPPTGPSSSYYHQPHYNQHSHHRYSTTSLSTDHPRDPGPYYPPSSSSSSYPHHHPPMHQQQQQPQPAQNPVLGRSYSSGALGGEGHHRSSSFSGGQGGYRPRPSLLKAAEEVPTRWEEAQAAAAAAAAARKQQEEAEAEKASRWNPNRYGNYPPYSGSGRQ